MSGPNLELQDLRMVAAIASAGTLTAAARELGVSQPALSLRLRQLEARAGARLYRRDGRALRPTALGATLLDPALRILAAIGDVERQLAEGAAGRTRRLRISTECYTTYRWLPRVVVALQPLAADVEISIVAEATGNPLAALRDDRLDLAIVTECDDATGLKVWPLFDDELYAVMSARDPLARRRTLEASDLADRTFVLYTGDDHPIERLFLAPAGIAKARRIVQVQLTEAIVELVRAGQGIACLAGWAFETLGDTRDLTRVRLGRNGLKRTWYAVTRDEAVPKHTQRFIRLVARLGPSPPLEVTARSRVPRAPASARTA